MMTIIMIAKILKIMLMILMMTIIPMLTLMTILTMMTLMLMMTIKTMMKMMTAHDNDEMVQTCCLYHVLDLLETVLIIVNVFLQVKESKLSLIEQFLVLHLLRHFLGQSLLLLQGEVQVELALCHGHVG